MLDERTMSRRIRYLYYPIGAWLVLAFLLRSTIESWLTAWRWFPYDGRVDWIVGRAFLAGTNPYSPESLRSLGIEGLGHPPTTAFWMLPFVRYELVEMSFIYGHVVLLLVFASLLLAVRDLRWPWPTLTAAVLFVAVTGTGWFRYQLMVAQIGALIAVAYVLAWLLVRRGHDLAAGCVLGLACTIKLHPGLMVLYFLLSRRYRAAMAAVASYLAVFVLMTSRLSLAAWSQYVASERAVVNTWLGDLHNASLDGIIVRAFTPSCQGKGLPTPTTTALFLAISGALCFGAWRLSRGGLTRGRTQDLSYALSTVLSVFLNPFVFEHYFLQLVFPLLVAITALAAGRQQGLSARWTAAGTIAVVAIAAMLAVDPFTKDAFLAPGQHLRLHVYEVMNWLHIVVLIVLLGALLSWFGRRQLAARRSPATPDIVDRASYAPT